MTTKSMVGALGAGALAVVLLAGPAAARCPYVAHRQVAQVRLGHDMHVGSSGGARQAARNEGRHARQERRVQNDRRNQQHWGE